MYANAERKEIIVVLAGCVGFADTILKRAKTFPGMAKEHLQAMLDSATAAMDTYMEGLDGAQIKGILRWANNSEIKAVPKSNATRDGEFFVLTAEEMQMLCNQVSGECMCCDKTAAQIKKCGVRKILLSAGAKAKNPNGACPFTDF